ncbi:MAG TPA: hypothetical protein EYG11_20705 [Candidatus Latescibacteria bacterium]|nr:hypothetical protein [Candidatus Handelsmanbacteria bacterium]HIL11125.1 hypothetical protein [Candidatus Latescibacterota bacterium]
MMVQWHISGGSTIQTLGSIMGSFVTPCRIIAGGEVDVLGRTTNEQNLVDSRIILVTYTPVKRKSRPPPPRCRRSSTTRIF